MARYILAVDVSRCNGCGACFLACKDEHIGNDHLPLTFAQPRRGHQWLRLDEIEQGQHSKVKVDYVPVMCQHCRKPACAKGAPAGAVTRRADGVVVLDVNKAKGCADMARQCPYGVLFWNADSETPQKCTLCAHMSDSGEKTTRCAEACPTKALLYGDMDDPASEIARYVAEKGDFTAYKPEWGTVPSVLYRALPAPFITGEVVLADQPDECCAGAEMVCVHAGGSKQATVTDFLGDFQFMGLEPGASYTVSASYPGYGDFTVTLVIQSAKDLGVITLKKH